MKKYLVVCAAALMMLPCFPLLSQEADEPGPGVEFTIIPRLDLSYEESELALGNSSLYSLFEGNITENLSFSPDIIRNADVVWIQNNRMGHSQFFSIVKQCKLAGVQMRYFGYASAEKCAEQLVKEDLEH